MKRNLQYELPGWSLDLDLGFAEIGVDESEVVWSKARIGGEVNRWSWGCVGLGFGVEGGCYHGCLGSEKLWELFVSRES